MFSLKPSEYLLPNPEDINANSENKKYAPNPAKGLSGDPSKPPRKQYMLMKMAPLPQGQPKFLRHSLSVEDIHGTKSRALYRGVAKNILDIKDIEGCRPKKWRQRDLKQYNMMDYRDVNNLKSSMNIKIPDFGITKPKDNFYNKAPEQSTKKMQRTWVQDKLDIFKKDKATNFLYPTRFAYADTDAVSWKSHITKDFEKHLPDNYGVGTVK